MKIRDIIWIDEVVEKLAWKHRVATSEVEETVHARCRIFKKEKGRKVEGEDLYLALGVTEGGRHLAVFFILKKDGKALVVTARDMKKCERRLYEEKH